MTKQNLIMGEVQIVHFYYQLDWTEHHLGDTSGCVSEGFVERFH